MGETLLSVSFSEYIDSMGKQQLCTVDFSAEAGEAVYLQISQQKRRQYFDILAGFRKPVSGDIQIADTAFYALAPEAQGLFRRQTIGIIPYGGGLIPEIPTLQQLALPLQLSGMPEAEIRQRIQECLCQQIPRHLLFNPPCRLNPRKKACVSILRAVIQKPQILIADGLLDDFIEEDQKELWQLLQSLRPKESVLVCLSCNRAPEMADWSQILCL